MVNAHAIKKIIKNPYFLYSYLVQRLQIISRYIPDEPYLKILYRGEFGKKLNLITPMTFNEKMQWLKLHDRKDEYSDKVDKYEVKKYVSNTIGEKYIIPTIGIWDCYDDIDFSQLPNRFVIKCTHDSGSVYICKDKTTFNTTKIRKDIEKKLKRNYYWNFREWPYKNIKPRIIVEQYIVDESGTELKDYKIFCFNGKPKYIQVDFGRFTNHERNLYSVDWEYMGFSSLYPTNPKHYISKPLCLSEMLDIAKKLAIGIPFVRIDLYVNRQNIYFGEMTFYHGAGLERYTPVEWDRKLGDLLSLPEE